MIVTENPVRATKPKLDMDIEAIRHFHTGPLQRCSRCGRMVFHPCLICETSRKGKVSDPFDGDRLDWVEFPIELQGDERKRYEYLRLKKITEEVRQWNQEETFSFS